MTRHLWKLLVPLRVMGKMGMGDKLQCQQLGQSTLRGADSQGLGSFRYSQGPWVLAAPPTGNKGHAGRVGTSSKTHQSLGSRKDSLSPLNPGSTAGSEYVLSDTSFSLLCSTWGRCLRTRLTWSSPHSQWPMPMSPIPQRGRPFTQY